MTQPLVQLGRGFGPTEITGAGSPPAIPTLAVKVLESTAIATISGGPGFVHRVYGTQGTTWTLLGTRSGNGQIAAENLTSGTHLLIAISESDGLYSLPSLPAMINIFSFASSEMHADIRELIDELREALSEYGKDLKFTLNPAAVYDPITGKTSGGTPTAYLVRCMAPYGVNLKYVDKDLVQQGDMETIALAESLDFDVVLGLKVEFDSEVWRVVHFTPIRAQETLVAYGFQLRRA